MVSAERLSAPRLGHESGWSAVVMDGYPALTWNADPAPASDRAIGLEIDERDRDDTGAVQQRDPPSL